MPRPPPRRRSEDINAPGQPAAPIPMLENARRQTILVFVTLVAGLLCMCVRSPGWGMDRKGGNQLIYEVPEDALQKLVLNEHTSIDKVMEHTVQIVRDRIDPTGTLDALVTRRGNNGIL